MGFFLGPILGGFLAGLAMFPCRNQWGMNIEGLFAFAASFLQGKDADKLLNVLKDPQRSARIQYRDDDVVSALVRRS